MDPTARPTVALYTEGLTAFTKGFRNMTAGLQILKVSLIKRDDQLSQIFDDFGVHPLESAGKQYLQAIMYFALKSTNLRQCIWRVESDMIEIGSMDGAQCSIQEQLGNNLGNKGLYF